MKYRTLTDDELVHFEQDLKAFLIINGVDGTIWEQINRDEPEKARGLVDLFSDQVLQTVYERIQYLEHRSPKNLLVFHVSNEWIELIALNTKSEFVDFTTSESIHHALTNHLSELEIFTSKKALQIEREIEVHRLLEQGAILSSEEFWNLLAEFLKK